MPDLKPIVNYIELNTSARLGTPMSIDKRIYEQKLVKKEYLDMVEHCHV